jgi:class 3 adenylate cyclase
MLERQRRPAQDFIENTHIEVQGLGPWRGLGQRPRAGAATSSRLRWWSAPDRTVRFRVGINVGDVIPDGTDIHGDVVNVAARLQAECPPGCICVSRAVRDHVQDRLNLAFEDLAACRS